MERRIEPAIHLSLFMILITTWYLGYSNLFHIISDNEDLCTNIEYPALIFASAAMTAYMSSVIVNVHWKRICRYTAWILTVYGINATMIAVSPSEVNYVNFMKPLHIMFLMTCAVSALPDSSLIIMRRNMIRSFCETD